MIDSSATIGTDDTASSTAGEIFERVFSDVGDFAAMSRAEAFLEEAGFSVGSNQRGAPRGIMFGAYSIAKWRNLSAYDRRALHGAMTGDMRNGPVTVTIYPRHAAKAEGR